MVLEARYETPRHEGTLGEGTLYRITPLSDSWEAATAGKAVRCRVAEADAFGLCAKPRITGVGMWREICFIG
jgi:hypothetical protein